MKCNALIDPQTKIAIANFGAEVNASQFPRCGYELSLEDKFCPSCGAKVACDNKSDAPVSTRNASKLEERWRKVVPRPEGNIATYVVCACASLLGAVVCYVLFAFGGFGQTGSVIMAIGATVLVAQMPKQVFGAYALMTMNAGGKIIAAQKFVIYACAGALIYFPWMFPVYGAAMALYEINEKCVMEENDDIMPDSELRRQLELQRRFVNPGRGSKRRQTWRVSLVDYYRNCRTMNVFSRSAYKKVYQLYFGKEKL